jgi:hypothetical protein
MAAPAPGLPPRPNLRPWAIGAAVVVALGFVAALITGGGASGTAEKVLASGEGTVHGVHYRVVASTDSNGPKQGPVPLYFTEYIGKQRPRRIQVPELSFYGDSVIASLKVTPKPPTLTFSWYRHSGDRTRDTKRYRVSPQGVQLY